MYVVWSAWSWFSRIPTRLTTCMLTSNPVKPAGLFVRLSENLPPFPVEGLCPYSLDCKPMAWQPVSTMPVQDQTHHSPMAQNADPVQICSAVSHLLKSGGLTRCQQASYWLGYQLPASLALYTELCIICLSQLAHHQCKSLMPAKSSHQVLWLIWQTSHCAPMPKPEQIYINGCTVAPGACRGQLVVQHIHLQRVPLHVSPAAFSRPLLFLPVPRGTHLCQFNSLHGCALN